MTQMLTLVGVSALILLHEAGHYLAARACGMRVLRFSFGFGPPVISRQFGETIWQIAWIPLGGFVQIDGMGPAENDASPADPRCYRSKTRLQRAAVLFAGPLTNWLLAALCLAMLGLTAGFSVSDETQAIVGATMEGGSAAAAGLQSGDKIVRVGDVATPDWATLVAQIRAAPEQELLFSVERQDSAPVQLRVTPQRDAASGHGVIGIVAPTRLVQARHVPAALWIGAAATWTITLQQTRLLWGMLSGQGHGKLAGLPGIIKMVSAQAKRGISRLFESLAWLSVGLCILNLAPIPALDGSRLLFLGIEGLFGRPINERIEGLLHTVGLFLLLGLMIFVSVRDLVHF